MSAYVVMVQVRDGLPPLPETFIMNYHMLTENQRALKTLEECRHDKPKTIEWQDNGTCRGFGATYANRWLIMVGASRTSPVPGNRMRRRHARRRILPSFGALRGDNTPTAALWGLRMVTMVKMATRVLLELYREAGGS